MTASLPIRDLVAWIALTTLAVCTPVGAQRPRPITWCEHPSRNAKWSTQQITVGIAQREGDDADSTVGMSRLSTPVLGLILESVAERVRRRAGFTTPANGSLPAADDRYTPAVMRTMVGFTLRGDGTIAAATAGPHSDTTLASDLIAALRESGEARELLIDGDPTSKFDIDIFVDHKRSARAEWRAFTLFAPRALPALVDRQRPAIRYPDAATHWEASFILQFVVGWNGKARRETMRTVPAIKAYRWPSQVERKVFEDFVEHVKYAVAQWEFLPAEVAGCLVDQLVQQQYTFRTK
jgi:hypothetical protein